jgi:hypothetical protein
MLKMSYWRNRRCLAAAVCPGDFPPRS